MQKMAIFGQKMAKITEKFLSTVNKTAFFGISDIFYIK